MYVYICLLQLEPMCHEDREFPALFTCISQGLKMYIQAFHTYLLNKGMNEWKNTFMSLSPYWTYSWTSTCKSQEINDLADNNMIGWQQQKYKEQWWRHASWLQTILQSYNNQNGMVLAQKQTHSSMEQNKEPKN